MHDKLVPIIVIAVFMAVAVFFILRDYSDFVSNIVHPSATPTTPNLYQGTDVQIKNIYKNPFNK